MNDRPNAAGLVRSNLELENCVYKIVNRNLNDAFSGREQATLDREYQSVRDVAVEVEGNKKNFKRHEIYSCLCAYINTRLESYGILKPFFNSLIAIPAYVLSLLFLLFCLAFATIITLACLLVRFQTINKSYFAPCTYNTDCDNTIGLQCSASDGTCNCPAVITKGHCDCSSGYFWNGTQCTVTLQYLANDCSADYMCDQTKYLVCLNRVCTCSTSKVFDLTAQACIYNYLGCFNDPRYSVNQYIYSPYSNGQMFYFVDICISTCRNLNTIYSSVFLYGNNRCYYLNSINTSVTATCELSCLGENNEIYLCGSSSNWVYRSYYLN